MATTASPAPRPRRAFADLRLGLFLHYVFFDADRPYGAGAIGRRHNGPPVMSLDELADGLDVDDVARVAQSMSAEFVIFTAWHANMNLLYPSAAMDRWRPGHSARRDVIADLLRALGRVGIDLILYVHPSDGHDFPQADQQALGWTTPPYTRWHAFVTEVFCELAQRYRGQVLGYWVDGGDPPTIASHLPDLRQAINAADPDLVLIQNEGIGEGRFRRWAHESARECVGDPFPCTDMQATPVVTGNWWADGSYQQWTAELAFRYFVLQSGCLGLRGGVAYSSGPYPGGQWEPGFAGFCAALGQYVRPFAPTLLGTRPSQAIVTRPGTALGGNRTPIVATETPEGDRTYLHVLHVPLTASVRVPAMAAAPIARQFTRARHWLTGRPVDLCQNEQGLTLTLSEGTWWQPLDTVIELT